MMFLSWESINLNFYSMSMMMTTLGWLSVFYFRKQFLISLLSLEVATLGIFLYLTLTLSKMNMPVSIGFFILVMGACEAAAGLSLLVSMTRYTGSDLYINLSSSTH